MAPFDRPCTTFYWSAIVNIALSGTVLSNLTYNDIITLKSGSEVTQDHSNRYHSKAFHSNYGSISHHLRDKARYWSKVVIFPYTLAFKAPVRVRGVSVGIMPSCLVWKN